MKHLNARREFFRRCGMGFGALAMADLLVQDSRSAMPTHFPGQAKHIIHIFLNGGVSQVDTFDPKPELTKRGGQMLPFDNLQTERKTGVALPSPFTFRQMVKAESPSAICFLIFQGVLMTYA